MRFYLLMTLLISFLNHGRAWSYEIESVKVASYSRPWILVRASHQGPETVSEIRLHLHGWTQDPQTGKGFYPQFDFNWPNPYAQPTMTDFQKFVDGYGIGRDVDLHPERMVLIPISRGHCDQYRELLNEFDQKYLQVLESFGIDSNQIKLTQVSAHSGGGDVLSQLLVDSKIRAFSNVDRVVFYDAIYSDQTRNRLISWLKLNSSEFSKELLLPVIYGQSPFLRSRSILTAFPNQEENEMKQIDQLKIMIQTKVVFNSSRIRILFENPAAKLLNHWTLVRELWSFD
jgi:hypothetical protein